MRCSRDHAAQRSGMVVEQVSQALATVTMTVRRDMVNGHDITHGDCMALFQRHRLRVRLQRLQPEHRGERFLD